MQKIILLLFCFIPISFGLYAQENNPKKDLCNCYEDIQEALFSRGHWSIRGSSFLSKGRLSNQIGQYAIQNPLSFGFSGTIDYTENFGKHFGIRIGFQVGALPLKSKFSIPHPTQDWTIDNNRLEIYEFWAFPIELIYRRSFHKNWLANVRAGVSLRKLSIDEFSIGTLVVDDLSNERYVFQWNNRFDTFRHQPNLIFGLGVSYINKYYHLISLNLVANVSLQDITINAPIPNGSYYVFYPDDPEKYSEGQFSTKGNYVGLELSYTFTRMRAKILNMHK